MTNQLRDRFKDIMLDIETFGTGTNAAIVSIGAVAFNPDTGELSAPEDRFHVRINLGKSENVGVVDARTVEWWLGQSEEARKALVQEPRDTLYNALVRFSGYVGRFANPHDDTVSLWSLPPTFDERIMREAFERNGLGFPLHYRCSADMRTVFKIAKRLGIEVNVPREGTHHDALDDACHQARTVCAAFAALRARGSQ